MSTNGNGIAINTIIQGLIALTAVVGTFSLVITGHTVPDIVLILDGAITAYYFSTMSTVSAARAVIKEQNQTE